MASGNSNGNSRKFLSPDNFLVIQGWMVTELALKGNELLIYALIYGFSQAEDQWFDGTLKYIAEWTNSTVRGVQKSISSLVEKNLIEKDEITKNKIKSCRYRVWNKVHGGMEQSSWGYGTKFMGGIEQSSWGYGTKFMGGIEQSSPHDNINNNIYNTPYTHNLTTFDYESPPKGDPTPKGGSKRKKEFVPPTLDEVAAYCASRGNKVDANKFWKYYNATDWTDSKGEKVRSWKHKCITWELSTMAKKESNHNTQSSFDTDEFFAAAVAKSYADVLAKSYADMEKCNSTQGESYEKNNEA